MKKALAPFAMIARHSLGMVMFTLGLLILGNGILFHMELGTEPRNLSVIIEESQLRAAFLAAYMVLSFFLWRALQDKGGHQDYFLGRLRFSRRRFYLVHALYNSLCYFLLFAAEALSLLALCTVTVTRFPESYNQQSVMLACYQNGLLHTVFPLSNWLGWITLFVMILALGVCSAASPTRSRRGKTSICITVLMCSYVARLLFKGVMVSLTSANVLQIIFCIVLSLIAFLGIWMSEEEKDV